MLEIAEGRLINTDKIISIELDDVYTTTSDSGKVQTSLNGAGIKQPRITINIEDGGYVFYGEKAEKLYKWFLEISKPAIF